MAPSTRSGSRNPIDSVSDQARISEQHDPTITEEIQDLSDPTPGSSEPIPDIRADAPAIPHITENNYQIEIAHLRQIADLQKELAAARSREAEILAQQILHTNRYRNGRESSEEGELVQQGEIQRTIPIFHDKFTIEKRDSWIRDLHALFKGAPRKFVGDPQKVLAASGYLSADNKKKWDAHIRSKPEDEDRWDAFEEWTKELLQNSYNITTHILLQIEDLQMLPYQDPTLFESQLTALESHLPEQSEEQKAQLFFRKLWKPLRNLIITNTNGELPKSRADMLYHASLLFGVHYSNDNKRKDPPADTSNNNRKRNHLDSTSNRYPNNHNPTNAPQATSGNDSRGRGGRNMRGQFSNRGRGSGRGRGRTPASGSNLIHHGSTSKDKQVQPGSTSEGACFLCGDPNHWAPNCPSKAKIQAFGKVTRESRKTTGKVTELN
jgi:hypothetical protein